MLNSLTWIITYTYFTVVIGQESEYIDLDLYNLKLIYKCSYCGTTIIHVLMLLQSQPRKYPTMRTWVDVGNVNFDLIYLVQYALWSSKALLW